VRHYAGFSATVSEQFASQQFLFLNTDLKEYFNVSTATGIIALSKVLPYGPATGIAYSPKPISEKKLKKIVSEQLSLLPSPLSATVDEFYLHKYQPYFSWRSLERSPSPYFRLADIQGDKHTFYVGAISSYGSSSLIWEQTFCLVQNYFPPLEDSLL